MNSPTWPSATVPNSSVATTVRRFEAKRCSLIAIAAASISREAATAKASSRTVSPGRPAAGARVISRRTVAPAGTSTAKTWGARPVKKTRRRAVPAGTGASVKAPSERVAASRLVPSMVTRAFSRYSPLPP